MCRMFDSKEFLKVMRLELKRSFVQRMSQKCLHKRQKVNFLLLFTEFIEQ